MSSTPAEDFGNALEALDAARESLADARRWLHDSYATAGLPADAIDSRADAETLIQAMGDDIIRTKSHLLHAITAMRAAGE